MWHQSIEQNDKLEPIGLENVDISFKKRVYHSSALSMLHLYGLKDRQ